MERGHRTGRAPACGPLLCERHPAPFTSNATQRRIAPRVSGGSVCAGSGSGAGPRTARSPPGTPCPTAGRTKRGPSWRNRRTDNHLTVTPRAVDRHRPFRNSPPPSVAPEHPGGKFRRFGRRGWTDGVVAVPRTSRSSYNRLDPRPSFHPTRLKEQTVQQSTRRPMTHPLRGIAMPKAPRPYFELRIGGFRVTANRVPTRLVTAIVTALGSVLGMWTIYGR